MSQTICDVTLSVIVPIYNEENTIAEVLDSLAEVAISNVKLEVIVIESNSTDRSRERAKSRCQAHGFQLILQPSPHGKGFAVREGLEYATGEIVLIQDADLEYNICDYEKLISPIMSGKSDFVLGVRSKHGWKVRQFENQAMRAFLLNLGHYVFVAFFNFIYGTRLSDPFTMFKVFRREAIAGLTLKSNRFDLDWELVGKLTRRGHQPLEIEVDYKARDFKMGKKVRLVRDPISWIWAAIRFRVERL